MNYKKKLKEAVKEGLQKDEPGLTIMIILLLIISRILSAYFVINLTTFISFVVAVLIVGVIIRLIRKTFQKYKKSDFYDRLFDIAEILFYLILLLITFWLMVKFQ